jgi:hypothetical protein
MTGKGDGLGGNGSGEASEGAEKEQEWLLAVAGEGKQGKSCEVNGRHWQMRGENQEGPDQELLVWQKGYVAPESLYSPSVPLVPSQ